MAKAATFTAATRIQSTLRPFSGICRFDTVAPTSAGINLANGNETDLLQLNACGEETVVEHVECLSSADDGLHVFGGMVELRHILSAFHSEDAYECDQGWQGMAQFLVGIQDTLLAQPTNPPAEAYLFDVEGDDVEDFNVDLCEMPYTEPVVHNMTLVTNGAPQALSYHSLPGGDWQNSIAHGMSDAGVEIQHFFSCDGYPAMTQWNILRVRNWRFSGGSDNQGGINLGRYNGNYNNQAAFNELLADSTCTVETMLVDAEFSIVDGQLVDGLDLHPLSNATVSAHYMATDPRLDAVPYHGAIAVGEVPWFMATTYASSTGLFGPEPELDVPGPGCMYPSACNYDALAVEDDGSCDFNSCAGCMYVLACNYSPSALKDDGSCEWESCAGCTFPDAENYDPAAAWDNGTCTFWTACGLLSCRHQRRWIHRHLGLARLALATATSAPTTDVTPGEIRPDRRLGVVPHTRCTHLTHPSAWGCSRRMCR